MKKLTCILFVFGVCLSATGQDQPKALDDWKHLDELLTAYNNYFVSEYNQSNKDAEFVRVWKEWIADAPEFVGYFQKTYGDTPQKVGEAFEGLEPLEGVNNYPVPLAGAMYEIDFDGLKTEVGIWLINAGDKHFADFERQSGDNPRDIEKKMQFAERALEAYRNAVEINPEGDYSAHVAKAEKASGEAKNAWEKAVDSLEWPGHNADFEGPGDPDDLAAAALKLLEKLREDGQGWSKPEYEDEHIPVAVCVTADTWGVEKTAPLTQEPTQFRLKVLVAFRGNADPEIAYCYPMYFYTKEELGVEKAPPFYYCNSEQYASFRMPMAKVGKGGGVVADSAPVAARGKAPGPGWLMRLLLTAVLLAGGLAASSGQVLASKAAPLSTIHSTLKGARNPIAWGLLVVGILAFFLTLVRLALFRDILPQAVAVCLGLALMAKGAPSASPETTGTKGAQLSPLDKIASALGPFEKPLGLAALVLGVLHLIAGGFGLL